MRGFVAVLLVLGEALLQGASDVPFLWVAKRLAAGARWCRAARADLFRSEPKDPPHA